MNNKLEQLQKKIQEAVPEIMELKKGCEVEIDNPKQTVSILGMSKCHDTPLVFTYETRNEHDWFGIQHLQVKWIKRILGRPITLEDVLVAMNETDNLHIHQDDWNVDISYQLTKVYKKWQLNKPLDQQSEETIEFLWELLVNKK